LDFPESRGLACRHNVAMSAAPAMLAMPGRKHLLEMRRRREAEIRKASIAPASDKPAEGVSSSAGDDKQADTDRDGARPADHPRRRPRA
jgi:hypothetical protein